MGSNRVWFWAHFGFTILLAVVVVLAFVALQLNSDLLLMNSLHGPIVLLFVMPGALLVFGINQLILWRRRPLVLRTGDKVVIVIVTVLTLITLLSTLSFDAGLVVVIFSVPLLMIAGITSTIMLAVNSSRAGLPAVAPEAVGAVPVPAASPVAATLDELFPAQPAAAPDAPAAEAPSAAPDAPDAAPDSPSASPYGPKG